MSCEHCYASAEGGSASPDLEKRGDFLKVSVQNDTLSGGKTCSGSIRYQIYGVR
jgi:hypothetical protein